MKFKYAKDEQGNLIDIAHLKEENRKSIFFCVGCNKELIPKLGKIKVHHFAHKHVLTCSKETYLHLLGKEIFYQNYTECLVNKKPFIIEMYQHQTCNHYENKLNRTCKLEKTYTSFDLTQFFDKILIEKRENFFIPDLMLMHKNNQDKLFIEIAVTHLSSEKKLNSDYRIVELKIENEEDLEPIHSKNLSVKNEKIKFENFKIKEKNGSLCQGFCKHQYNFFTLDKEGRCLSKQINLQQINHRLTNEKEKIAKYEISSEFLDFKKKVAEYANQHLKVKNCFICRYHGENNFTEQPIFCKFLKIICNSNEAVLCKYFKLEKKYVDELLEEETEEEDF